MNHFFGEDGGANLGPPPFCGSIPQSSFPYIILIILVMLDEVNMGRMVVRPQGDLRGFSVAGNAEV